MDKSEHISMNNIKTNQPLRTGNRICRHIRRPIVSKSSQLELAFAVIWAVVQTGGTN